ncbi:DNA-processing protein DprA [Bacteroidales bacterium OttesenSCG-928-B11]|nr:DNA-processing protein DprA [Bacteroidales bacterium OttesenSCG-928-E04]MDL2309236.1 DNA-processing protein DprA [Bacteroidales bacterium OttesenSCG-928-C03]MDL2312500.1 DNA-processing protein DprA [Bacteroidales bacterium OttesenSCG-928-B11]
MLNETQYRMALQYLSNYGNIIIKRIIDKCGSASAMFNDSALCQDFIRKINKRLPRPVITDEIRRRVEEEYAWMERAGVKTCFVTDDNYPHRFHNCNDSPYMFYYKGEGEFSRQKSVAIVGTRNASPYGKEIVRKIVSELAACNTTIVSGLAEGIDTIAHEEALAHNLHTVAVLGSGLDRIYPASNIQLSRNIVENSGALITEFPYKSIPDKKNFPKRNRIIAALADAVIVAESATKGGSIITAYIAHSYNRDVFAVPGSVFQNSHAGCHELIRRNIAGIITSGNELMEMMGWSDEKPKTVQRSLFIELTEKEKQIISLIEHHGDCSVDIINNGIRNFTPSQVAGILLGLELKGVLECRPGKIYKLV